MTKEEREIKKQEIIDSLKLSDGTLPPQKVVQEIVKRKLEMLQKEEENK